MYNEAQRSYMFIRFSLWSNGQINLAGFFKKTYTYMYKGVTWAKYCYDATVQKFGYKMIFIFEENGSIYGLKSAQTCLLWTRI